MVHRGIFSDKTSEVELNIFKDKFAKLKLYTVKKNVLFVYKISSFVAILFIKIHG